MASIAQGLIQGLATGFGGDVLATDLLQKQVELKKGQQQLKASEYQASADKVWSKAIMDVLAGSKQTQPTPPIAPQPGQASVPGVQPGQAAAPPATPTAAGLGGGAPTQTPASATLQTLGAPPQASAPAAPPPIADPMNAASILAKIKADNPNLDPGVLSSVVNDHLMPMLSQQQQADYKHFQQQLEWEKFTAGERDKMNMLYWRYQQLDDMMKRFGQTHDLAVQKQAAKQGMAQVRQKHVEADHKAKEDKKAADAKAAGKPVKLPPALQTKLQTLNKRQGWLESQLRQARDLGQLDRIPGLEKQVTDVQKEADDLLAKAEALDAQGAPNQPIPAKGSGDTSKAGQSEATVPADKPVGPFTPEQWDALKPTQRKIWRDLADGKITKEEAIKEQNALLTPGQ